MLKELKNAIVSVVLLTVLTGVIYPLAVTATAQLAFRVKADGSLMPNKLGSDLISQSFDDPRYFWPRLSGAGYDPASSSGTNFAPTNPALIDAAKARVAALKAADPENTGPIPVDLVTASGSGLDPHISVAAAEYQASRVARVRGLPLDTVRARMAEATESPTFGLLGDARVNVLRLNLALDGKLADASNNKVAAEWANAIGHRGNAFVSQ